MTIQFVRTTRRTRLPVVTMLALFSAFGTKVSAQSTCRATTRELSTIGPRSRFGAITAAGRSDRDVMADAAVCAAKPESISAISVALAGRTLQISRLPAAVRAAFLGGLADPREDGPAWSGRGANAFVRG